MSGSLKRILLLPHISVHNANALSSPFTIGFPAMTAWLGAVHALQRKLQSAGFNALQFKATGVVSHQCDLQTHRGAGDFVHSIVGTGNPLDKTGARSAFIEEARCHLDVSLLIEYTDIDQDDNEQALELISHQLKSAMKIAGGDIIDFEQPSMLKLEQGNKKDLQALIRKLMPGYAIIERRELMIEAMENGQDAMDSLIDYLAIHHRCEKDDDGNVSWESSRKAKGWIVPIATGFHGISELGQAKNQRDPDTLHRFSESVITLGEFKMPYKINSVDEILWHYHTDLENNLYLCRQHEPVSSVENNSNDIHSLFNNY